MLVTIDEARQFLRIDGTDDDGLLEGLLKASESLCLGILRQEEVEAGASDIVRTAILYAAAYLYEHRDEADHTKRALTLRALLSGVRKEEF